mmetsp:Transcript_26254/g.49873  ORF Transcript_26254/g.49873 Transcript_26254/m.49873 type:complete len:137 (+) Transcript_26254:356-766(+)
MPWMNHFHPMCNIRMKALKIRHTHGRAGNGVITQFCLPLPDVLKYTSICSSVRPFVSGTNFITNTKVKMISIVQHKNTPAGVMVSIRPLNTCVTTKELLQLASVATLLASPRACAGKISDINTQGMAPSPNEKVTM